MVEHLDIMAVFAGTHNEESSYKLMQLMEDKGIAKMTNVFSLDNC